MLSAYSWKYGTGTFYIYLQDHISYWWTRFVIQNEMSFTSIS
jgi:hypothetical protein